MFFVSPSHPQLPKEDAFVFPVNSLVVKLDLLHGQGVFKIWFGPEDTQQNKWKETLRTDRRNIVYYCHHPSSVHLCSFKVLKITLCNDFKAMGLKLAEKAAPSLLRNPKSILRSRLTDTIAFLLQNSRI